jgi:hypothetical protein
MKVMNGVRIIFALIALAAVQIDAVKTKIIKTEKQQPEVKEVDAVLDEVCSELETATNKAAKEITAGTVAKNHARKAAIDGLMTEEAAAVIIEAEDKKIAEIKQDLMKLAEGALAVADETEEQASYMSQFIGGAKNLGAGILAPFRAGYGYSEQEKNLARAVIAELEVLKKDETDQAVIQKLDDEIYQQQLISGDAMSTRQKLLIGAAMVAASVAGYVLSGYLGGTGAGDTGTGTGDTGTGTGDTGVSIPSVDEITSNYSEQVYQGYKPGKKSSIVPGIEAASQFQEENYKGAKLGGSGIQKAVEAIDKATKPVTTFYTPGIEAASKPTEETFEGFEPGGESSIVPGIKKASKSETTFKGYGPGETSSAVPVAQAIATAAEEQSSKPMVDVYEGAEEGQSYFDRLKGWWKGPQGAEVKTPEEKDWEAKTQKDKIELHPILDTVRELEKEKGDKGDFWAPKDEAILKAKTEEKDKKFAESIKEDVDIIKKYSPDAAKEPSKFEQQKQLRMQKMENQRAANQAKIDAQLKKQQEARAQMQ